MAAIQVIPIPDKEEGGAGGAPPAFPL